MTKNMYNMTDKIIMGLAQFRKRSLCETSCSSNPKKKLAAANPVKSETHLFIPLIKVLIKN